MNIFYDPRLIEEAVFHAQHDRGDSERFDQRRNQIYEIADLDERERLFQELNRTCFDRLELGEVIERCLSEQPLIAAHVERCFVIGASQAKEEGAELFVAPDGAMQDKERRTLRLLTQPESLLNADALQTFLRRELFHIADMLDPAFAYEPMLPKADGGPTYDTLITNRYRVLWDVTIAGRMLRRGWCDGVVQEQQYGEFVHGFPMLKDNSEELFAKFFAADQPRHAELADFAFDPRKAGDALVQHAAPGTHCPLCKFPTHSFEPQPDQLGVETLRAIAEDFPNWQPALGLCSQCADLYRARQLSLAALHALPGWNASGKESFRA
jgi:hypothetical protein